MIGAVVSIIGLCAFGAWVVAAWSAINVLALSPKGKGFQVLMNLGWLNHAQIVQDIGPPAAPHLARYRLALGTFFLCVFAAMAAVFLMLMVAQNGEAP